MKAKAAKWGIWSFYLFLAGRDFFVSCDVVSCELIAQCTCYNGAGMLLGIDPTSRKLIPIRPTPDWRWRRIELDLRRISGGTFIGDDMAEETGLLPVERIENHILLIRGEKVMLDADLAELYGVSTGALIKP